jgi:hypothetical protein
MCLNPASAPFREGYSRATASINPIPTITHLIVVGGCASELAHDPFRRVRLHHRQGHEPGRPRHGHRFDKVVALATRRRHQAPVRSRIDYPTGTRTRWRLLCPTQHAMGTFNMTAAWSPRASTLMTAAPRACVLSPRTRRAEATPNISKDLHAHHTTVHSINERPQVFF